MYNLVSHSLRLRWLGVDTYHEAVIYMRRDCHVCRSEGFEAQARILVRCHGRSIIATLNVIASDLLGPGESALSEAAWHLLGAREGDQITLARPAVEAGFLITRVESVFLDIILSIKALKTELTEFRVRDQQQVDGRRAA